MPSGSAPATVLTFKEARHLVEEHASRLQPSGTEFVNVLAAAGRVLAEPVLADRDIPPFPRSTRDGYALRAADLVELPAELNVIGEIKAGESLDRIPSLHTGQAVAIMTGAPVPDGADAVVMVEFTAREDTRVEIKKSATAGENIVPRGAEAGQESVLLERGLRLNDAAIALAASVGKTQLAVHKRPRVALLTTGPTQIRNSNSYSLAVQVQNAGGEPVLLPIAPDEPKALRAMGRSTGSP